MEQPQPAPLFGGRYEIVAEKESLGSSSKRVEVIDRESWRCCWACGSTENEAGEAFCAYCGADLRNRRYHGIITTEPTGLLLIADITNKTARELLPPIWDTVEAHGRTLIIQRQNDASPIVLPLEEVTALRIGLALANLLTVLHSNHIELGALVPGDIGLTASGTPCLFSVNNMRRIDANDYEEAVRSDLQALAGLLESITNTPRMTRRLDETAFAADTTTSNTNPTIAHILRDIRTRAIEDAAELESRLDELYADHTQPLALDQVIGYATHTGMVRDHNEDSLLALKLCINNTSVERAWGLYIVADGMGGHAGGEIASGMAIRRVAEVIMGEYLSFSLGIGVDYDEDHVNHVVRHAVLQANDAVRQEASIRGNDMGTTITMALIIGDRATIANVGDSRTYLYRDGILQRISQDHSLVMRLVELGQLREEDIYYHPQRNAVLRSLGDKPSIAVDIFTRRLRSGDMLLLCSDGQWEMTYDADIAHILARHNDPGQACQELIDAANRVGGEDNITSVLIRFA